MKRQTNLTGIFLQIQDRVHKIRTHILQLIASKELRPYIKNIYICMANTCAQCGLTSHQSFSSAGSGTLKTINYQIEKH